MFDLHFINDFKQPKREARRIIPKDMQNRGEFTFSYIALMLSSTVVCTLGMITNSAAVIIGGMIIAPFMWPLLRTSYALSTGRRKMLIRSFSLILISIALTAGGSALVAFVSPFKLVTQEILSRTTPTTLEIFIAFAAAVIAALAVAHPKIGETIAGVAIATSLVPPLCVTGIGIAYLNFDIAFGSFLLFLTNVVTIILTSTLIFTYFLYGKQFRRLKTRSMLALVLLLLIISWPLTMQLKSTIENAQIVSQSSEIFMTELEKQAPKSEVQDFQASLDKNKDQISVRAVVLLPSTRNLTYDQEKEITTKLESRLNKKVSLQLILQDSLPLVTRESVNESAERTELKNELQTMLLRLDPGLRINTIDAELTNDGDWDVAATVRAADQDVVSIKELEDLETDMAALVNKPVSISLDIIQSRLIRSNALQ
ncbi:DUF389 domain-containing protein [Candidatus Saccharibacteria bacterium]|nr:DUF389 domain-containing protein [Candidatus Saccharibacteria bacterium]